MSADRQPSGDFIVRSKHVVFPDGVRAASLRVRDGRIDTVAGYAEDPGSTPLVDADPCWVAPGLVDTHVHVNQPGRTDWEGFESATRAAAAGGVTTLLDMPLNSVPATVSPQALAQKASEAEGAVWIDVGFLGGVVPGNEQELEPLWSAGVRAFKCFMIDSGVPEFPPVDEAGLGSALEKLRRLGAPLMAHAELASPMVRAQKAFKALEPGRRRAYRNYLASRPDAGEVEAIELLIRLCRRLKTPVHIVHLASALALPALEAARHEGLPLTVETCPHYLFFEAEGISDGATEFKCAPPIRSSANRERLWDGLRRGVIDMVVSDHSPSPPEGKSLHDGDFGAAWGGVASLQFGLAAVWTEARRRGRSAESLFEWMSRRPAQLAGLQGRKGEISVGADADLVFWQPDSCWTVNAEAIHHRHKLTPYLGLTLYGKVRRVHLRGRPVFEDGRHRPTPQGRLILPHL